MKIKKRQKVLIFLLLMLLFGFSCILSKDDTSALSNEDFIRFHVIANSNSAEDQLLKLQVRDGLLKSINRGLLAETMASAEPDMSEVSLDMEKTQEYINKNLDGFRQDALDIVSAGGYSYDVDTSLDVAFIPQKTYGNNIFPAGNYNALTVTIGEGRGENWWCVLFPPLCLIDGESEKINKEVYKELIGDEKYSVLIEEKEKPKKLKLKFKALELLKEKN
jgi:stage II sporulation protein R